MTSLLRIVCLFVLFSCVTAVKIKVGSFWLTYVPNVRSKLPGQIPYLGAQILGSFVSTDWIKLKGPGSSSIFCDRLNYTCLGLNKGPNTIILKLQNLTDISQQWTPNNATLQLTNGAVSNNLCATSKFVGPFGNPAFLSTLNMQTCAVPSQQFTIA